MGRGKSAGRRFTCYQWLYVDKEAAEEEREERIEHGEQHGERGRAADDPDAVEHRRPNQVREAESGGESVRLDSAVFVMVEAHGWIGDGGTQEGGQHAHRDGVEEGARDDVREGAVATAAFGVRARPTDETDETDETDGRLMRLAIWRGCDGYVGSAPGWHPCNGFSQQLRGLGPCGRRTRRRALGSIEFALRATWRWIGGR